MSYVKTVTEGYKELSDECRYLMTENKKLKEKLSRLEETLKLLKYDITQAYNDMVCNDIVDDIEEL